MAALPVIASGRDIRLDLFRGLALWFIFLDHIPTNIVSWLTVRNYGFSDATEIFVFISGYTAVIAYSRMMLNDGWLRASIRLCESLAIVTQATCAEKATNSRMCAT